jgi:hypothetical protein
MILSSLPVHLPVSPGTVSHCHRPGVTALVRVTHRRRAGHAGSSQARLGAFAARSGPRNGRAAAGPWQTRSRRGPGPQTRTRMRRGRPRGPIHWANFPDAFKCPSRRAACHAAAARAGSRGSESLRRSQECPCPCPSPGLRRQAAAAARRPPPSDSDSGRPLTLRPTP